jgi:predicted branched-subunit amino acid permease
MFFQRRNWAHPQFRQGLNDMLPVALGIGAWGLMTGVASVKYGLSVTVSLLLSTVVYAGSSQLAAMPLLVAGAPMWVILATGFCVNLRFVVFSAHLRPYLMHLPLWKRLITGYLTADMNYVLFVQRYPEPVDATRTDFDRMDTERAAQQAYFAGNQFVSWVAWAGASTVGIALASAVPTEWGLGFAGILALTGVICSLATSRLRVLAVALGGSAAVAAFALPLKLNILVGIAAAVAICMVWEQMTTPNAGPKP